MIASYGGGLGACQQLNKENVVYMCMEYHSAMKKNEIVSVSGKWMTLEVIMLSKIS